MPLTISTQDGQTEFEPRTTLSGRVDWAGHESPERLDLRLIWYTEGRGDRDIGIARTLRVEHLSSIGAQDFDFELPTGPFSCSGQLLSIRWAIEATLSPNRETARFELVLAPDGREVELQRPAA